MFNRRIRIATASIAMTIATACSVNSSEKAPTAIPSPTPTVDLSALDTGSYSTAPRRLGNVTSEREGRQVEAIRMADAMVDHETVDPSLDNRYGSLPLVTPEGIALNLTLASEVAVTEPVLTKYGAICAYIAASNDQDLEYSREERAKDDPKVLGVALIRFPNADSAGSAAVEMDAVDFAFNADNEPVPVTKFPEARAHWRPGRPSLTATLAHREFVVHVTAWNPTPNLKTLVGLIEEAYSAQIPLLEAFRPTPVSEIADLPKDPDGLLGRLANLTPGEDPPMSKNFATWGPRAGRAQFDTPDKRAVYDKAGVDRVAGWIDPQRGSAAIYRAKDNAGAMLVMEDSVRLGRLRDDRPVLAPAGLPGATCFERQAGTGDESTLVYGCWLTYDRFAATVRGFDKQDVRQRAAAQYALLVNEL